jgi:hypothetical protein
MLLAMQVRKLHQFAFIHRRQHVVVVVLGGLGVVVALLVHGDVAGLHQRGAIGAQHVAGAPGTRDQVHGDGIEHGMSHLAGDGALPDQRIKPKLIGIDLAFQLLRRDRGRSGTHRLMRFLRVF